LVINSTSLTIGRNASERWGLSRIVLNLVSIRFNLVSVEDFNSSNETKRRKKIEIIIFVSCIFKWILTIRLLDTFSVKIVLLSLVVSILFFIIGFLFVMIGFFVLIPLIPLIF